MNNEAYLAMSYILAASSLCGLVYAIVCVRHGLSPAWYLIAGFAFLNVTTLPRTINNSLLYFGVKGAVAFFAQLNWLLNDSLWPGLAVAVTCFALACRGLAKGALIKADREEND